MSFARFSTLYTAIERRLGRLDSLYARTVRKIYARRMEAIVSEFDDIMKRIDIQNREFDAVASLAKKYDLLCGIPVVDNDYPEYRSRYEASVRSLIKAFKDNGREF